MQDAVIDGGFLQGQGEKICTEEILPEIVVAGGVCEVGIRPDDKAFAFRVGGTLKVLEKLEADNNGIFDL